jgi:hypothetical protein
MASEKHIFTKVKAARELLREQADIILQKYLENVQQAMDRGDNETAAKALQWLIEHMPSEDDGTKIVDTSVDKQAPQAQQTERPAIQIGIQVGGVNPKQLPATKPKELPIEATVIKGE